MLFIIYVIKNHSITRLIFEEIFSFFYNQGKNFHNYSRPMKIKFTRTSESFQFGSESYKYI